MTTSSTIPNDPVPRPSAGQPGRQARRPRRGRGPLGRLWRSLSERTIVSLITLCGISAILFVFGIFFFVFREGWPFLRDVFSFDDFFLNTKWKPKSHYDKQYGILGMLAGTGVVTVIAMVIAVPFGLGAAVFISEVCGRKTKEFFKVLIEMLAAIPSVVWGFIGMLVLGPLIKQYTGATVPINALTGGIVVGMMSLPLIVSIADDAIRAVPDTYREAAEALGATRWQTIRKVIFPAARGGLLAAVLLGVGRAVGETMAVAMAAGSAINVPFSSEFPYVHVLTPVRPLTAVIRTELGEAVTGSRHYQALFVIGIVLFTISFVINLTADLLVRGVRRRR